MSNQSISNMNCGGNFCFSEYRAGNNSDEENMFKANKPSTESIYLLFGILLGFSLSAAIVLALFLDHPKKYYLVNNLIKLCLIYWIWIQRVEKDSKKQEITGWKLLIATFRHLRNPYQILIIPMTFFSGYAFAFIMADFTAVSILYIVVKLSSIPKLLIQLIVVPFFF